MDLTNLRDSLDSSSRERHPASASAKRSELRLTRDFKAAALQLTTLYRTSLSSSKRSYAAGYAQALGDILDVVNLRNQQRPVQATAASHANAESEQEDLKWLMRYLRARLEAIKTDCEEEEEVDGTDDEEEGIASAGNNVSVLRDVSTAPISANAAQLNNSSSQSGREPSTGRQTRNAALRSSPANKSTSEQSNNDAPSSLFTFTAPSDSTARAVAPVPNLAHGTSSARSRRGRTLGQSSVAAASNTPPRAVRASSSDEEDAHTTPTSRYGLHSASRRSAVSTPSSIGGSAATSPSLNTASAAAAAASRLGKRRSGRERMSNLELFGRAMSAKRRRHLGDRHDNERFSPTPPPP